ncbi:unnamed protein product, partial [Tilletia laevis]
QRHQSPPAAVRLAAAISLKNLCKTAWTAEDAAAAQDSETTIVVHESDKVAVRAQLLPLLFHLASSTGPAASTPGLGGVRSQLSEAVALVAAHDFPVAWPELVSSLAEQLKNSQDFGVLTTVLETSHSIFGRWRSAFRTNELYTDINLVLEQFATPFLEFLQKTDASLSDPNIPAGPIVTQLANATRLNLIVFHDLSAQDLPPAFEDNMPSLSALFIKYLSFTRPDLASESDQELTPEQGEEDETQPGPLELIRIEVCDIADIYAHRYLDAFEALPRFVQAVWEMLGACGPLRKYDQLVARAITFLSTVVRMGNQRSMFEAKETLDQFISRIILPNIALRPQDEFLFEEEPIDYIRLDMESNIDTDTRRRAASAFTRALMEQFESTITGVISTYISQYLAAYAADPAANWRSKDTAICLLTSIASRSETTTQGVSSTNSLVNVVQFTADDVKPFAEAILLAAFRTIRSGSSPEKVAENDYMMKCAMRLIFTARSSIVPFYAPILDNLRAILVEIAKPFRAAQSSFQSYQVLLPPLLTPVLWESKGNVSALVRLLRAFIAQGSAGIVAGNQLQALLGIHQRLITSRVNDLFGFELITALCEHVPIASMQPFLKPVLTMMLTRLQTAKTEKFSNGFIIFFASFCAVPQEGYPDHAVAAFESVQAGLLPSLLQGIILPEMQKIAERQRKIVAVGMTRLLTQSSLMLSEPTVKVWTPTLEALLKLFLLPQDRSTSAEDDISGVDWDDAGAAGFQASFARLSASEPGAGRRPGGSEALATRWAGEDARVYMSRELGAARHAACSFPLLTPSPVTIPTLYLLPVASGREHNASWIVAALQPDDSG